MKIEAYQYGNNPAAAIEGWDPNALGGDDYETPRALALYEAIEASPDDMEYVRRP